MVCIIVNNDNLLTDLNPIENILRITWQQMLIKNFIVNLLKKF